MPELVTVSRFRFSVYNLVFVINLNDEREVCSFQLHFLTLPAFKVKQEYSGLVERKGETKRLKVIAESAAKTKRLMVYAEEF